MAFKATAGPKTVKKPPMRPSFVLGSRPQTMRAAPAPRIKPMVGVTQYGKQSPGGGLGGPGVADNPGGAAFGDTGETGMS